MAESSNFAFFKEHDPVFFQLANAAERVFSSDPNTTLIKLRQLGEALAQDLAVRAGIEFDATTSQADLLSRLSREIQLDGNIRTPVQERALPEHCHHRRPVDHRYRRAAHLPFGIHAPGAFAHSLRTDEGPCDSPLR
ncbi:hypothetical protein [Pseudomonas mosselii]|uniref:hypothetical protein n=1 Tax=Pseudomonas mosselii TaxID=78327 RepID=UPI002FCD169F